MCDRSMGGMGGLMSRLILWMIELQLLMMMVIGWGGG